MAPRKQTAPKPAASRRRSKRLSEASPKRYLEEEEEVRPAKRRVKAVVEDGDGWVGGDGEDEGEGEGEYDGDGDEGEGEGEGEGEDDVDDENDENDENDEDDEDKPPKVEIIPLEKLRDEGGVAYKDETVHPNTTLFLTDLQANNKRPWLKAHDGEYRRALKDWNSFVACVTERVIAVDDTVPELPIKDIVFRIHRDIRFSKDPTPYKPYFSAAWSRTGRKGPYASYYLHLQPGHSFIGGGLWSPSSQALGRLRASIHAEPERWREVLGGRELKRCFLGGGEEETWEEMQTWEAVGTFWMRNSLTALKGYDSNHPDIELLKLKRFAVTTSIKDGVLGRGGLVLE
ncbi:hypothetical protein CDD80_125 [Ophiocordyceps camponoti-rufipedis]|uniref:Uncharacterized protein n=1 Tax=Ophiocordyceps camponoti-rufipedis TaxID=2004952 RepID=A0A2C5Z7M9_9HYPO|nr:hypothetical protein CDD80_125 [Ophiocordyceps camponoti-rufipedis]